MEINSVQNFLAYYEKIRQRTLRVINRIPPDKIEWTYKECQFTIGDLIRHLAALERYMFAENFQFKPSRYPGHSKELADGYGNILDFMNRMHTETMEIIARIRDEDLQKKCTTPNGTPITLWKWMRAMIEHEIHHRGQVYIYLSMLNVETPPLYGLTSEEVFEKSES